MEAKPSMLGDADKVSKQWVKEGCLYLVATPIGNRYDMGQRALEVLKQCDWVACEDTRVTSKLFPDGVKAKLIPYHEHNEKVQAEQLLLKLKEGASLALVSDAGTPGISDPGFRLVRACRREGIELISVPGPCALVAALAASGLPTHQFFYAGFLAPKTAARKRFFEAQASAGYTLILYESRHRIQKCVADIVEVLGPERVICVARELSKLYENFITAPASIVLEQLQGKQCKGEFVVMIAPGDYAL